MHIAIFILCNYYYYYYYLKALTVFFFALVESYDSSKCSQCPRRDYFLRKLSCRRGDGQVKLENLVYKLMPVKFPL